MMYSDITYFSIKRTPAVQVSDIERTAKCDECGTDVVTTSRQKVLCKACRQVRAKRNQQRAKAKRRSPEHKKIWAD